jgi:glutamate racemase
VSGVRPHPRSAAIGVFDSGVGGLTVVRELFRQLPSERVSYFGDTARYPYGNKARETLIRFSLENARFLAREPLKMLVVACNSSSAYCLPSLRYAMGIPVVGVIEPGARAAHAASKNRKIGVIGTKATIDSQAYQQALKDLDARLKISAKACPLFVPLVEEGWLDHAVTRLVAKEYLAGLKRQGTDTLVLGCTHYPLIRKALQRVMGPKVTLVDSATETARTVRELLTSQGLLNPGPALAAGKHRFFVSDVPEKFVAVAKRFLGPELPPVEQAGP